MNESLELDHSVALEDIRVLSVRVDSGRNEKHEVFWSAVFYDPSPELPSSDHRVVIGALHVHAPRGHATVHVGSLLSPLPSDGTSIDALRDRIAGSSALETLYDFARMTIRTATALAEIRLKLPDKAPEAEVLHHSEVEAAEKSRESKDRGELTD